MAFVKKTWKDRIAEFPTRRRLTKEDNTSELVTVAREEGTLSQEGDAFSAENMNDLENRIDAEFTEVNGKLKLNLQTSVETKIGTLDGKDLFKKFMKKDKHLNKVSGDCIYRNRKMYYKKEDNYKSPSNNFDYSIKAKLIKSPGFLLNKYRNDTALKDNHLNENKNYMNIPKMENFNMHIFISCGHK